MVKAIYKITNLINNKTYIGQTVEPEKRWWQHCNNAKNRRDEYPIHNAIRKYGKDNFLFEVIEWTEDYNEREIELIKQYNSISPNGYNVAEGGANAVLIGEDNGRNTIPSSAIPLIIADLQKSNLSDRKIALKYNTTDKIVSDINHGRTHRLKGTEYPVRVKKGRQQLSEYEANAIKELLKESTLSLEEIASRYHTSKTNISQINCGRNFKRDKDNYPIRKERVRVNQFG